MKKRYLIFIAFSIVVVITFLFNRHLVDSQASSVSVWVTTGDKQKLLTEESVEVNTKNKEDAPVITVDEHVTYQTMEGFGASLTEASAYLLQQLTEEERAKLLAELFGADGISLNLLRQPMGASDFSLGHDSYDDVPAGQQDVELQHFSIERDKRLIIPVLKEIHDIQPNLQMIASPWSAPAWMKEGENINGGTLKRVYYDSYARYFVKFVSAYKQEGFFVKAVTVQNDPSWEMNTYPTMKMSAVEQAEFVGAYLGPAFQKNNIKAKIFVGDDNWEQSQYVLEVMSNQKALPYISGSAFHCYKGTPDEQLKIFSIYPDKEIWFTECSGGNWSSSFADDLRWDMSNLIIGVPRHYGKSILFWNIALNETNGPANEYCKTCRGVVTIDSASHQILKNEEYYVLGHISKFVKPGAVRIKSNIPDHFENVAFRNPDGSKVLIVLNNGNETNLFFVKAGDTSFAYTLPGGAAATFVWN